MLNRRQALGSGVAAAMLATSGARAQAREVSISRQPGILYMPLGAPNNDRVGTDRPGDNLFSS